MKAPNSRKAGHPKQRCGFCGMVFRSRKQRTKHTRLCGK